MKKFASFLLGFSMLLGVAHAQTKQPISLLSSTGSTAGQAIVSTGPSSAPAWSTVTAGTLSPVAANTVIANATGSTASPTAKALPSCSTSASALLYTTSSGFSCNTAVNAAQLGGATFSAPGAIGGTTPAAGAFTTLNASGNDAILVQNTSGQSIPDSTVTVVTGWTSVFNRNGANFNTSTGVFTAPATGYYFINARIGYQSAASVVGGQYVAQIFANGSVVAAGLLTAETTQSVLRSVSVSALVSLTAGQTVTIRAFQNQGGARSLITANPEHNFLSINRIP